MKLNYLPRLLFATSTPPPGGLDPKAAREVAKAYKELESDVDYFYTSLKKTTEEIANQTRGVKAFTAVYSELSKQADKLKYDQEDISRLSEKDLKTIKKKLEQGEADLKRAVEIKKEAKDQADIRIKDLNRELALNKEIANRFSIHSEAEKKAAEKQIEQLDQRLEKEQKIVTAYEESEKFLTDQINGYPKLIKAAQDRLKEEEKINKTMGLSGAAVDGIVGALGKLGISGKYFEDVKDKMRETAKSGSKWKTAMTGVKGIASGIGEALADPLIEITLIVKAVQFWYELSMGVDKNITAIAKSTGFTKDATQELYKSYIGLQETSKNIYVNTKNLAEATTQLNESFGTTLVLSDKQLLDQIQMTKNMGLTVEEANNLQAAALQNGKSAEEYNDTILDSVANLYKQRGILLDGKKVLQDVAKVSGQISALYKNDPKLIGQAVVQMKALGLSIEDAKNQANSLLEFESSIQAQTEAELLTGKTINLDKARYLALQGDIAGASKEALKNIKSFAEFSRMGPLAQDQMAKSIGLTSDKLAESLKYQDNIKKLSKQDKDILDEKIKKLEDLGDIEGANALKRQIGNGKDIAAIVSQKEIADKFNAILEKMKSIFADKLGPPLVKILDKIADWLPNIISSVKILADILKVAFLPLTVAWDMIKGIGEAFYGLWKFITGDFTGGIKMMGKALYDYFIQPFKDIWGAFKSLGSDIIGLFTGSKEEPKIAAHADGGITTGPQIGMIGEAGPEAIIPLNSPKAGKMLGGVTGGGDMTSVVNAIVELRTSINALASRPVQIQVDGQTLANTVAKNVPTSYGNLLNPSSRVYGG